MSLPLVYAAATLIYQRRRGGDQCKEARHGFGKQRDMCMTLSIKSNTARLLARHLLGRGEVEREEEGTKRYSG
ncbi:hypothetical protein E2C01_095868 [Portunus trituberculatus]|uniref:Uncharacterized protein n=1 Tax=Portunus trituberculatus TaxID=210409 RepID=A0A5B7JU61_PORTR|nr:hypothetical protein [Portunus trituberculatus]